jgi:protease-4
VTSSDYIYHHLRKLAEERKLPIVVSMGGICASGGYYIAMSVGDQKDTIFAEPTTWTGSIGVIIPHYNVGDLLANWDIKDDSVTSGPLKAMGSPTRKLTPEMAQEEHRVLQELVDQSFGEFKEIVTASRPQLAKDADKLAAATTGQVFTAQQALELGLVDKLGFLEDAVDRAIQLANLNAKDVRVVKYTQSAGLFGDALFGPTASAGSSANAALQFKLDAIAELATPRAYYMFSWLPPLVVNSR